MCGIVGDFAYARKVVDAAALAAATETLRRRGPDGAGYWQEGPVALGHRRLAILDTSQRGNQPMLSASGRYVVVHNGEIYNFRDVRRQLGLLDSYWKSDSDTEVILAAYERWGPDCLGRFEGMFAFGIWDREEHALFLARDRVGVKPLFIARYSGGISFASRPRALFALRPEISSQLSEQALRLYSDAGYIPAPWSVYSAIEKLPPAHWIYCSKKGVTSERYWSRSTVSQENAGSESDLVARLDELTDKAVAARMVSDVPVGAFLSGGLDSALVVAKMRKLATNQVRAFTIGFDDPSLDESANARIIARHLNINHTVETMRVDDLLAQVDPFFDEFDEPLSDSSVFPTLAVSQLARRDVTVALSGDGGDEQFAGYHYHLLAKRLAILIRVNIGLRKLASTFLRKFHSHNLQLLAMALVQDNLPEAYAFVRSTSKDFRSAYNWRDSLNTIDQGQLFAKMLDRFHSGLCASELAQRLDFETILPSDYLYKVDSASMYYSLEAREPWLDTQLTMWSARLPEKYKLRRGVGKYLWRKLAERYLPYEIVNGPKRGFSVPLARWLRGPLRDWATERLNDPILAAALPVDVKEIKRIFDMHLTEQRDAHPFLWNLLSLTEFLARRRSA